MIGEYYTAFLTCSNEEIMKKRPHLQKKKVLTQNDIHHPTDSLKVVVKLNELGWKLHPNLPYSPDLTPSDYFLFPNLKRWLQGKRFYPNEEVEWETDAYFGRFSVEYYKTSIKMLRDRWIKCISMEGVYFE